VHRQAQQADAQDRSAEAHAGRRKAAPRTRPAQQPGERVRNLPMTTRRSLVAAAALIASSLGLVHSAVRADGGRHASGPESLRGTGAPSSEACDNQVDKSVFVLSAKSYVSSETNCAVDWVSETAGARGPIYSAHLQCANAGQQGRPITSNLVILPKDIDQIS